MSANKSISIASVVLVLAVAFVIYVAIHVHQKRTSATELMRTDLEIFDHFASGFVKENNGRRLEGSASYDEPIKSDAGRIVFRPTTGVTVRYVISSSEGGSFSGVAMSRWSEKECAIYSDLPLPPATEPREVGCDK